MPPSIAKESYANDPMKPTRKPPLAVMTEPGPVHEPTAAPVTQPAPPAANAFGNDLEYCPKIAKPS